MASKAFQKIYTKLESITKATVTLRSQGITNDELATVDGRLSQVVKIKGDLITLQVFGGTEGIPTDSEVIFFGEPPALNVGEDLAGRFFNAFGDPIDKGPSVDGRKKIYRRTICKSHTEENNLLNSYPPVLPVLTSTTH